MYVVVVRLKAAVMPDCVHVLGSLRDAEDYAETWIVERGGRRITVHEAFETDDIVVSLHLAESMSRDLLAYLYQPI